MHDTEAMCNEHGRQLLLIWFMNYLPFIIVNNVWAISTLIITSCCTCHNYIRNFFLNGIFWGGEGRGGSIRVLWTLFLVFYPKWPSFKFDLEIIKTNIFSEIHDDHVKNLTSRVLRFSFGLAW